MPKQPSLLTETQLQCCGLVNRVSNLRVS